MPLARDRRIHGITRGAAPLTHTCNRFLHLCSGMAVEQHSLSENCKRILMSCLPSQRAGASTSRTGGRLPWPVRRNMRQAAARPSTRVASSTPWKALLSYSGRKLYRTALLRQPDFQDPSFDLLQRFAVSIGEKIAIARFALKKGEQAAQACANACCC